MPRNLVQILAITAVITFINIEYTEVSELPYQETFMTCC